MLIRQHRSNLEDSIKTAKEINPTYNGIVRHINKTLSFPITITKKDIKIKHYGFDDRIGWNNYIITIDNYGVYGFIDRIPKDLYE